MAEKFPGVFGYECQQFSNINIFDFFLFSKILLPVVPETCVPRVHVHYRNMFMSLPTSEPHLSITQAMLAGLFFVCFFLFTGFVRSNFFIIKIEKNLLPVILICTPVVTVPHQANITAYTTTPIPTPITAGERPPPFFFLPSSSSSSSPSSSSSSSSIRSNPVDARRLGSRKKSKDMSVLTS